MIYVIGFLISLQFQGKDHSFQNDNYSCLIICLQLPYLHVRPENQLTE